jgi:hypothetical protein
MYLYFFLGKTISKSLILALLTHNPVMALFQVYVMLLLGGEFGLAGLFPQALPLCLLFYLPGLIWELGRKIRTRKEETNYETYSKIFGRPLACFLPLLCSGLMFALLFYFGPSLSLSLWLITALCCTFALLVLVFLLFLAGALKRGVTLKHAVQVYLLVFNGGLLADLIFVHRIRF